MRDISGMSVLVTGGGSGIGEGVARYYVERGARVTICGRRAEKIAAVSDALGEYCLGVQADVTSDQDRQRLIEAAVEHGSGLDALISNAGNMYRGPLAELEADKVLELFNANVVAGMMLTQLAVPHLAARQGAVIFIGSVHNRRAFPGASPYAATKAAIESVTRVFAAELGSEGVRVNCVVPGAVPTEINQRAGLMDDESARARLDAMASIHALGRIGTAEEIAEAIDYLVRGAWTTGAVLDVDGGLGLGLTDA